MAAELPVSPLAPKDGFPDLPIVPGIRFASAAAGVRYEGRDDVALIEIAAGATIAGVFTTSATRAAPVLWCQEQLAKPQEPDKGFAFLINSGNANAFTGKSGFDSSERLAESVSDVLSLPERHVFLSSTGVIGEALPDERIREQLASLAAELAPDRIASAARAIMTTDTYPKGAFERVTLDGTEITLTGIAKGSGMIAPDMATMLVYLFSDISITQPVLDRIVRDVNAQTFNCITVDSDTSTSDTLLMAATGAAEMRRIDSEDDPRLEEFRNALCRLMTDLAHQVVRDGEGATKFVTVRIEGAASDADAHRVGKAIADSPLVKTAIAGEDPNWGRVVMAVGKSGVAADRDKLAISFGSIPVAESGWVSPEYSEVEAARYMKGEEIDITVDLGLGNGQATIWTCDLTHTYISINADYRS